MAAPVYKNFTQAVISGTGTATAPADTAIGDLVIVFVWSQGTNAATLTHTIQSTFTQIRSHSHDDGTTDGRLSVACKVATVAGAQTYVPYTIANATAAQTCAACLTVTGADTAFPASWIQGSATDATATAPNPPTLTGLNGDALILAIGAWHVTTAAATSATVMANYTLRVNGPTGSHVTHLAVATRAMTGLVAATEDPAIFVDAITPNGSVAMTLAIPGLYTAATYYVKTSGNDGNTGLSDAQAWKTLGPVNSHAFVPGDTVLFNGGDTFIGGLYLHNVPGHSASPVTLASYGTGKATISSAVGSVGCYAYQMAGMVIQNLNFTGPGIATANKEGILFYNDAASPTVYPYIRINGCALTGYTNGISIGGGAGASGYSDVRIESCDCYANSTNGILTFAVNNNSNSNIYIGYCKAYNNLGVAGQANPTGSGIQIGEVSGCTVEFCSTYGNGASQTAAPGPVGIWCYDSTGVTIQNCESYDNRSGGGDGDGFDIDGGCTNCIIQYCYSHGNKGCGFALFQYAGAAAFSGNIIRYNISESDQGGGIALWGADAASKITASSIYNNTVYASLAPALDVFNSNLTTITVTNNIFLTTGGVALVDHAGTTGLTFSKNNYYALSGAFVIWWGGTQYSSRTAWGQDTGGFQANPMLNSPGSGGTVGDATQLPTLTAYMISSLSSPMVNVGAVVASPGTRDFYGDVLFSGAIDIGADEFYPTGGLYTNLVAYWKLDEVATGAARADSVGSNPLTDAISNISGVAGKIGNAVSMTGSTQILSAPGNLVLNTGDSDFTIACWIKGSSPLGSSPVAGKGWRTVSHVDRCWVLQLNAAANRMLFSVEGSATTAVNSLVAVSSGIWYFVVAWHDSVNDQLGIQVNNATPDLVAHSGGVHSSTSSFDLGCGFQTSTYWTGLIDEAGFWKRILTTDERTALYNGGAGITYPFPAAVAVGQPYRKLTGGIPHMRIGHHSIW